MYTFVSFTVAKLFEKVWETPMVKLAHDTGVSDVDVAKAYRKAVRGEESRFLTYRR
ncbi:hypothetical protein OKW11_000277 [Pseudomonas baetica]|nr:hypothetical protein [Pseudomonas baetica]